MRVAVLLLVYAGIRWYTPTTALLQHAYSGLPEYSAHVCESACFVAQCTACTAGRAVQLHFSAILCNTLQYSAILWNTLQTPSNNCLGATCSSPLIACTAPPLGGVVVVSSSDWPWIDLCIVPDVDDVNVYQGNSSFPLSPWLHRLHPRACLVPTLP